MTFLKAVSIAVLMTCVWSPACGGDDAILKSGAKDWKYFDGVEAPKKWHTVEFDDAKWKSGQAPLGYGDEDIKQEISFGDDKDKKHITAYFRHIVEIDEQAKAKKYLVKLVCDDGCVVYVNSKEAFRHNLPKKGEIKSDTKANFTVSGQLERYALSFLIDAEKLHSGKNLISVSAHQIDAHSSDLAFDMSLTPITDDETLEKTENNIQSEQKILTQIEEAYKQALAEQQ